VVADQYAGSKALFVEFFGRKTYTVAGPAALVRKFQVPLYVGAVVRTGKLRFTLYLKETPLIVTEDKQADLENMARAMNQVFEEYIRQYPAQWFWMHRRWR
jgi:KDO2-lipid IV(A) lauroyltransferase